MNFYVIELVVALIAKIILSIVCIYVARRTLKFAFKKQGFSVFRKLALRFGTLIFSLLLFVLSLTTFWEMPKNIKDIVMLSYAPEPKTPQELVGMGSAFLLGGTVEKDYTKARECFEKAAESGCAEAFFMLGALYREGLGVDVDIQKGNDFIYKAANSNFHAAQFVLGAMYLEGRGVEHDIEKGMYYLKLAANQNNKEALCLLNSLHNEDKKNDS